MSLVVSDNETSCSTRQTDPDTHAGSQVTNRHAHAGQVSLSGRWPAVPPATEHQLLRAGSVASAKGRARVSSATRCAIGACSCQFTTRKDSLDTVAFEFNGGPRQTLGWLKPSEKLNAIPLDASDAIIARQRRIGMPRTLRRRFWLESILAAASTVFFLLTLFSRDWVEVVFHVAPDAGTGAFEWMLVAFTATIAAASLLLARWEWQRAV